MARGLSTIAARIVTNQDALAEYGITVENVDGSLKSTFDVLSELKPKWDAMTDAQRVALGDTLAGQNQYKVLAAVMQNFETAVEATETAYNSAGSAAQENSRYMESLEAKTTLLKATFQDFANNVINSEFVGGLLNVANALLKIANTDLGRFITQVAMISSAGFGLSQLMKISNLLDTLGSQFSSFAGVISTIANPSVVSAVGGLGNALTMAVSGAGGLSAIALPALAAISAAVLGVIEVVKLLKNTYEETHPPFEQAKKDAEELAGSIANSKARLEEINNLGWADRTAEIEKERQELEKLIEQQEKELELAQMREAQAASRELSGRTGTGEATRIHVMSSTKDIDTTTYTSMSAAIKDLAEKEGLAGETTDELKAQLLELGYAFLTMKEDTKLTADEVNALDTDALNSLSEQIKENKGLNAVLSESYNELNAKITPVYQQLVSLENAYKNGTVGARELTDSEKALKEAYEKNIVTMAQFETSGKSSYQIIADLANVLGVSIDKAKNLAVQYGAVSSSISGYKDKIEQTEDGTWKLVDATDDLADSLEDVVDASVTGNDAAYQLAEQFLSDAKQAENTTGAIADLVAQEIIFNNTGYSVAQKIAALQALAIQAGVTKDAIAGISTAGIGKPKVNIKQAKQMAEQLVAEKGGNVNDYIKQIMSETQSTDLSALWEQYADLIDKAGSSSTSTGGGGSTGKSAAEIAAEEAAAAAKQAWENQKQKELYFLKLQQAEIQSNVDAAKAEVDDYQTQLDNITKAQEAEVAAIKKELEGQLKIIQAQKDALDKWQDAIDEKSDDISNLIDYNQEYADKQIDNLEKEKDAIQETIDAINDKYDKQIEALETTNSELDKEIEREKLLKALADARAKKTLVFKNGRFSYEQDIEAIGTAQAALDKFDREQQIEKEKELIEENRKNELQYSKDEQAALDAEIERWKKYKEGWANLISDYNYQQNALLASQKYGMNLESQTWTQRLNNVNKFADAYADIMAQQAEVNKQQTALQEEQARLQEIASARQEEVTARMQQQYDQIDALMQQAQARYEQYQEQLKNINQDISDKEGQSYTDLPRVLKSVNGQAPSDAKVGDYIVTGGGIFQITGGYPGGWQSSKITGTKFSDVSSAKNWLSSMGYQFQYAKGSLSTHGGISLVGENGPELRVTKSGDGILPSNITKNLWSWGRLDPGKVLGIDKLSNLSNLIFNNANLSFPNITSGGDARLFVENLKNLAYQYAFAR